MKDFAPGFFANNNSDPFTNLLSNEEEISQDPAALQEAFVADPEFNRNLLIDKDVLSERALEKLAVYLRDITQKDRESRKGWIELVHKVKPYLGFELEDPEVDKSNSQSGTSNQSAVRSKTFDTTFSTAVLRLWALIRSELLPATGPVGFRTNISNE